MDGESNSCSGGINFDYGEFCRQCDFIDHLYSGAVLTKDEMEEEYRLLLLGDLPGPESLLDPTLSRIAYCQIGNDCQFAGNSI